MPPTSISSYDLARLIFEAATHRNAQDRLETLCYAEYPAEWENGRARALELLDAWMPPAKAGEAMLEKRAS